MHVSFRNRLTFFFVLLVILPVLAVAFVGILIVRDSEEEKTDSTLTQAQTAAEGLYSESRERSRRRRRPGKGCSRNQRSGRRRSY